VAALVAMTSRAAILKAVRVLLICLVAARLSSPVLAATTQRPGTAMVCEATLGQSIMAITNAFSGWRYHGMLFGQLDNHFDLAKGRFLSEPATNEWRLETAGLPGTSQILVPRNKAMVPYTAQFLITAEPLASNQSMLRVSTISASVPDGREMGVHGGWAVHMKHIPPVLEQETNVLRRIGQQLASIQAGHLEPLPATLDTTEGLKRPLKIDLDMHPEAKADLLRAIQAETNAALRQELIKMLTTATSGIPK
jgi:hypothetical protein